MELQAEISKLRGKYSKVSQKQQPAAAQITNESAIVAPTEVSIAPSNQKSVASTEH